MNRQQFPARAVFGRWPVADRLCLYLKVVDHAAPKPFRPLAGVTPTGRLSLGHILSTDHCAERAIRAFAPWWARFFTPSNVLQVSRARLRRQPTMAAAVGQDRIENIPVAAKHERVDRTAEAEPKAATRLQFREHLLKQRATRLLNLID